MTERELPENLRNTRRDDATTAYSRNAADAQVGLADEDKPDWRPPETNPEPRPTEPTLDTPPPDLKL